MSPTARSRSTRDQQLTTAAARTKDLLEAFGRYFSHVEQSPLGGDLVLTCAVCRTTKILARAQLADAGHVLAQLNDAHRVHGPHAPKVRR